MTEQIPIEEFLAQSTKAISLKGKSRPKNIDNTFGFKTRGRKKKGVGLRKYEKKGGSK